ncbi:MAG: 6,7-dimethyl-8-ribityllumazine synthase [Verrucomicrobiota bacterium]
MSHLPPRPRRTTRGQHFTIIASRYNESYTNALVQATIQEILGYLPEAKVELHQVPGAYEIPVAVEFVARRADSPGVIIALGLILEGKTKHADLIAQTVTDALQRTATTHLIPVIDAVLLCLDEKQAYARCMGDNMNRGTEAARAALEMADVMDKLAATYPAKTNG